MKVKVLKECRYKGTPLSVGTEIEIEANVAHIWLKNGYAEELKESQAQEEKAEAKPKAKPKTTTRKSK